MRKKIIVLMLAAMMAFPTAVFAAPDSEASSSSVSTSSVSEAEEEAASEKKPEEEGTAEEEDAAADASSASSAVSTSEETPDETEENLSIADQIIQGASVGAVTPNTITVEYVFDDESTDVWSEGACNSIGNGYYITTKRRVLPDMDSSEFTELVKKKTEIYKSVDIVLDEEAIEQHLQIFVTDASGEKQLADRITTGSTSNPEIGIVKIATQAAKGAVISNGLPEPGSPAVTYECQNGVYSKLQITVAGTDSNGNVRFTGGSDNVQLGSLIYNSDGYAFAMVVSSGRDTGSAIGASTIAKELSVMDVPFGQQQEVEEDKKEEEEIGNQYDTSEITKKISEAEHIDRTLYTEESLAALDEAVDSAKSVLEKIDELNDQKTIDNAAAAIQEAMDALEERGTMMDFIPMIAIGIMVVVALVFAYLLIFKKPKSKSDSAKKKAEKKPVQKASQKPAKKKAKKIIEEEPEEDEDDDYDDDEDDDEDEDEDDGAGDTAVLKNRKKDYLIRISNGRKITLSKPKFLMGKEKAKVDYWIDHNSTVSRVHCRLNRQDDEWYIEDLKSTNFTYVNEEKLERNEKRVLEDGDIIKVSNEEFEYHVGS